MKSRNNPFLPFALTLALSATLPAAVLTWDITPADSAVTGGTGDWNTTNTNWTSDGGVTNVSWPASSTGDDDATFGGTGGTVTIAGGGVTANDISFTTTGYTLAGGPLSLTSIDPDGAGPLTAPFPVLNAGPASHVQPATINSNIVSSVGLEKTGGSTLTLGGDLSSLSGTIRINGGVVSSPANNNSGITLANTITPPTTAAFDIKNNNFLALGGVTLGAGVSHTLNGGGGYSAPQGAIRGTAGVNVVQGAVSIADAAVRLGNTGTSTTFSGPITAAASSGFGMLLRIGSNQGLVFSNNANSWEGTTTLGDGSFYFHPGSLPSATNLALAGSGNTWFETNGTFSRAIGTAAGEVQFNATAGRVNGLSARGGPLTVNIGGVVTPATLVWGSGGFVPGALGLNGPNATHPITLANPIDLNGAARQIDVSASTANLEGGISNSSATAAAIRKTGGGTLPYNPGAAYTLTLAGLNTSGGTLELSSGTYTVTGSGATGAPAGTAGFIVATGGTFRLSGATVNVTGGGSLFTAGNTGGGSNNFILESGTFDGGGKEVLHAYGAAGTLTMNGGLFVGGEFRISQSAAGVVNLNGGTLRVRNLKHNNNSETVNFNGGTLQAKENRTDFITAAVDVLNIRSGGAVIDSNGFNIAVPKALSEDPSSTGGGLTKRGNGILDLTAAANNHTGTNLIQGGVLRVADNAQLGSATTPIAPVTVDGGEFGVSGTTISSITSLGRTFTYITGGFHVADASHTLDVDIDLTGSGGLSKSGPGKITLSGDNDFTGNIAFGSGATGWIEVDSATDLGIGPKTGTITSSGTSGTGGIRLLGGITATEVDLSIAGRNADPQTQQVLWNVSGNNIWPGDILIANTGGTYYLRSDADTLELSGTLGNTLAASPTSDTRAFNLQGPGNYLVSGAVVDGVNANRFVALSANGSGTVTLTGTNTYTGTTTVADGVLLVNGNNSAATGAISVNGDAVLGGTGTLGGAVTVTTDAKLAPGTSAGTLTTSANVGGAGTLDIEIDGATADKLVLTGAGTLDISTLKLNIATLVGGATQPVYVIVDSAAAITGAAFASVTGVPSGYTLTYNYNDGVDSNNIALVSTTGSPFTTWATTNGLAGGNAAAGADPDNDGLDNAIEFVIGGQPNPANPGAASNGLAPTIDASGSNLVFTFRRTDLALTQPGIAINVEYGSNLTGWTTAQDGVNGISVVPTNDFYGAGVDRVVVTIPKALAAGSSMFARLNVVIP